MLIFIWLILKRGISFREKGEGEGEYTRERVRKRINKLNDVADNVSNFVFRVK